MPPVAWHSGGDNSIDHVLSELTALGLAGSAIISFVGDHGQHVGEQNLWEKMTNFDDFFLEVWDRFKQHVMLK
jgi:arylsulfatase A-like enzyme